MEPTIDLHPEESTYDHILSIRTRMINRVLIMFACFAPFMLIISMTRAIQHGWSLVYFSHIILGIVTLGGAIFRNRLPYRIKVILFLGIAFALGAMGLPAFGLVGGGHIILITFAILASISFGTKAGLVVSLINVLYMSAIGIAVCTGKITFAFDIQAFATSPSAWAAVIIDYILIIPLSVIAIGTVFSQLQTTLSSDRENHASHQRLANNLTTSFLYRYFGTGNLEYVSSSAEQILGYTQEELSSMKELLTDLPVNKDAFQLNNTEGRDSKRPPFEIQVYHKNGSRRWLHMSETVVQTILGQKVEGVAHDITRRKIRETAIENILKTFPAGSGSEFYEGLINQLARTLQSDAVFFGSIIEPDHETVKTDAIYIDGKMTDNIEYRLAGTPCEKMNQQGLSIWTSGVQKTFPQAEMLRKLDIESYAGMPLFSKSGQRIGFLTALWKEPAFESELIEPVFKMYAEHLLIEYERQKEEKKRTLLEEQLRQSQKMDAVGQLAGGIAHDFNNMLMGIMGASDLLKMRLKGDKDAIEYHEMIRTSSRRAADLTSQLLTFARKQSIGTTKTDVHETIENAVALLSSTLDRRISIQTQLKAGDSLITGDASQLQNAIMNLGINAAHAMPDGGTITISTEARSLSSTYCAESTFQLESGNYIAVTVHDEGHGISDHNLEKIFEPFFTTKDLGEGTGLGLSTVLGTVQQHRGEIRVESSPGKGARFILNLPLCCTSPREDLKPEEPITGSGRVLLIEDEPIIQETVSATLQQLGYTVETADNGRIGLDLFREAEGSFDLVILDMVMPEMNGRDCFFKLKETDPEVRVILSSGHADEKDIRQMRNGGLSAVIEKPFSSAKLSHLALKVLNGGTEI